MNTHGESSAEVQAEAEAERAELVSTLDQLRENLRPENMVDEVMASAKITTADISDRIWQTARAHPLPSTLIAIGAAMILGVGQKLRSAASDREPRNDAPAARTSRSIPDSRDADDSSASSAFAKIGEAADAAKQQISSQLQAVGSRAAASASQIAASAQSLRRQAVRRPSGLNSSSRATPSGDPTMNQYARSRDQITGSLSRLLEEQPLVLAALGVAVGAAIGTAIPSTDVEGRLMGDASVSLKSRAQDLAQSELAHLKETASTTLDNLKKTAADHGLSSENITGLMQDAKSNVTDAAQDIADHASDSAGMKG